MKVDLPSVAFEYAFVCDDVRQDTNAKYIFIGAYVNNILLTETPAFIRLRLVMRFYPKVSKFSLGLRISLNGKVLKIIDATIMSPLLDPETLPSPDLDLDVLGPGTLSFDVTDEDISAGAGPDVRWSRLYEIPVINVAPTGPLS
ncbi:hypothetical protein [Terricaulis sp.]|uniref:hypothetical protein n=1 Tax=Terricaulis sp. TaxID=2768686 RepID=UPI002AC385F7|nr:hypothetical protein [Terricaulis sp.]MDZ4690245.1 hypothetical protein [Terricaulis sp.]